MRAENHMNRRGQLSISLLVFSAVTVIMVGGFVLWAGSFLNLSLRGFNKTSAFSIAEAGIEYYRWHLAHAAGDYWDGRGATSTGPYVHDYYDKSGTLVGTFSLDITPPPEGSTVVTIASTGKVAADSSVTKTIRVKFGIPSLAKYSIVSNDNLRFGSGTEVFGELMSNKGIHFDGIAHNIIRSALTSYDDPDHGGQEEFAVHTHTDPQDPLPPAAVPARTDVFMAGREFPVPAVDFTGLTQDLSTLRAQATSSGFYATSSGAFGFDLVFGASSTYQVYKITALTPAPNGCTNTSNEPGWGMWGIQTETLWKSGTIPANGVFFFEDHLWVRGQVNGSRVTVASGKFPDNPSTWTNIIVNNDLLYTNYDGTDAIALIAQNNFLVGWQSNDVLRIDAALVAQNGRVGRYYYAPPNNQSQSNKCAPNSTREHITIYGMILSNTRYEFGFEDTTGYRERTLIYDPNFFFGPPPSFPLAASNYVQISWEEVQ